MTQALGEPGPRNLITDIAGIRVGHASDDRLKSGSTVLLLDAPAIASYAVLGGAPGTRESDLLAPENTVQSVDAFVLSGGSAFGLDAASGVQAFLREQGRGFEVAGCRVPIVPTAILFDLANGGAKDWGRFPPYREFGYEAAAAASRDFGLGSVGAGTGALTARIKGGLGSASLVLPSGITVGALAAVNAVGSPLMGDTRHFWAAPFEMEKEFGGLGLPSELAPDIARPRTKLDARPGANTTIAILATDVKLGKGAARRLAIAAHDGFARALWPAHTDYDGDLVFALATGSSGIEPNVPETLELAAAAASVMARAIARGVFAAKPAEGDRLPIWGDLA